MSKPAQEDLEQARRHENHLVGQVYHLIRANQRLEDQLFRLTKMTEIADILRERRLTRDTFELEPPPLVVPAEAKRAWAAIEELLDTLEEAAGVELLAVLKTELGVVRSEAWRPDPSWHADVRTRLLAAEQAVAYLREQSRELDALRREKDSIMDGAAQLEQNVEDLWKVLNEKTTHIQRLEKQLTRIWDSLPYRFLNFVRGPFRRGSGS